MRMTGEPRVAGIGLGSDVESEERRMLRGSHREALLRCERAGKPCYGRPVARGSRMLEASSALGHARARTLRISASDAVGVRNGPADKPVTTWPMYVVHRGGLQSEILADTNCRRGGGLSQEPRVVRLEPRRRWTAQRAGEVLEPTRGAAGRALTQGLTQAAREVDSSAHARWKPGHDVRRPAQR